MISCFDLFKIGIGPSSSHTVGPMKAARMFLEAFDDLTSIQRIEVTLYGSLSATGKGHGSDKAILLGLMGHQAETVDTDKADQWVEDVQSNGRIQLMGHHDIRFGYDEHLIFSSQQLPAHPNGMNFTAYGSDGLVLHKQSYYSVGGGFILDENEISNSADSASDDSNTAPFPFYSAESLLEICNREQLSISEVMLRNELHWHSEEEINQRLDSIWDCMVTCIQRGCSTEGIMPGPLQVKRRAAGLYTRLSSNAEFSQSDSLIGMDWLTCYALAVNEENATGGRVVTAPTNGAAGIIPAVMRHFQRSRPDAPNAWHRRFLFVATAIGWLYKNNASISGADVGCQGEVGVACSMAAGALAELLGGSPLQVENAAEIGMEHNLGLTCDPVGGLVQVPCIERNAMGAVKAVNAARMSLLGDGTHFVSLDKVIKTMRDTGADMKTKYKETARGGLAVNVIEC